MASLWSATWAEHRAQGSKSFCFGRTSGEVRADEAARAYFRCRWDAHRPIRRLFRLTPIRRRRSSENVSPRRSGRQALAGSGAPGPTATPPVGRFSVQCFKLSQVAGITGAATGCPNLVREPPTAWRAGTMRFRVRKSKAAPDDRGPHRTSPNSYCLAGSTMIRPRPRLSR